MNPNLWNFNPQQPVEQQRSQSRWPNNEQQTTPVQDGMVMGPPVMINNITSDQLPQPVTIMTPFGLPVQALSIEAVEQRIIQKAEEQRLQEQNLLRLSEEETENVFELKDIENKINSLLKKSNDSNVDNEEEQKKDEEPKKKKDIYFKPINIQYIIDRLSELVPQPSNNPNQNLTERVTRDVVKIYQSLRPTRAELNKRKPFLEKLQNIISNRWPGANPKLELFGSSANEFCFPNADIDACLVISSDVGDEKSIVTKLSASLKKENMKQVKALTKARVPIVKFYDPTSHFACDICINNELALYNTKLIATYARIDMRFRYLGYLIKHWAKRRKINDPYNGTLSSYAYLLLVVNFLQQRKPPILPPLQIIEEDSNLKQELLVEGFDVYYFQKMDYLKNFGSKNLESTGELLLGFFKLYASEFSFRDLVVCPRYGNYVLKRDKEWKEKNKGRDSFLFCIEDPFEITHNLGRVVDQQNLDLLKEEFQRAHKILSRSGNILEVCDEYIEK